MKHAQPVHFLLERTRARAWFQSLNAKLFIVMALLTSVLTIAVAISIISSFKVSIESYTKDLALRTARGVIEDINRLDPELKFRRETAETLLTWTNPEDVYQIDIFAAAIVDEENYVEVWATSGARPEEVIKDDGEIQRMMESAEENAELITQSDGRTLWRVYIPIQDGRPGRKPRVLLRAYCSMDRWNAVWKSTYTFTIKMLPIVLLIEFALLWGLTSAFVRSPMRKILKAMELLGEGDISARAKLRGEDELGQIARRFDTMADELQRASQERETLLSEIQGFNTTLQERIDAALSELQAKNNELELLMERISLLREELGQQERLAVAGQLTAAFAHEVGTPLNLVNGHLQLLIGEPNIDDRMRDRLSTIHLQIDRVGEIVRKLLGLARPIEPKRELVHLTSLLEELQRLWAPTLAARKVRFQAQIPDNCSLRVDRKQLEQLFINLVNNAVYAMPDGGCISLELTQNQAPASEVTAPAKAQPDSAKSHAWEFALSDTGTGIPAEILDKVFKPMFTTKPEGKGTGLGLAICREIVRAHGGDIRIESRVGRGTTVRFTLP